MSISRAIDPSAGTSALMPPAGARSIQELTTAILHGVPFLPPQPSVVGAEYPPAWFAALGGTTAE